MREQGDRQRERREIKERRARKSVQRFPCLRSREELWTSIIIYFYIWILHVCSRSGLSNSHNAHVIGGGRMWDTHQTCCRSDNQRYREAGRTGSTLPQGRFSYVSVCKVQEATVQNCQLISQDDDFVILFSLSLSLSLRFPFAEDGSIVWTWIRDFVFFSSLSPTLACKRLR